MNKTKIVEPLENAKDLMEEKITPLTILFGVVACLLGVGLIYLAYLLIAHFSHSETTYYFIWSSGMSFRCWIDLSSVPIDCSLFSFRRRLIFSFNKKGYHINQILM